MEEEEKKEKKKKSNIFFHNGARENRPLTPTKNDPRAALWTTGTSGKALFDKPLNTFALYRNLVSTEVFINNNKTVLLIVLLYCYSSTLPRYAKKM